MKTPLLAAAVLLGLACPVRVSAIELSLEENKAERGNIGFVDTQRLFKLFPETIKAKENFEEAVRQAEDQINMRKAEVLRLRKEIDELKVERAVLAKSTPTAAAMSAGGSEPTRAAPAGATGTSSPQERRGEPVLPIGTPPTTPPRTVAAVPVAASTATANEPLLKPAVSSPTAILQLPGFGGVVSSATAAQPLIINLPGATTGQVTVSPPTGASSPIGIAPRVPAPPTPTVSSTTAQTTQDAALAALDEKVAQKTRELQRKQTQARDEQAAAEKNLLDLESRRSEILLGKIYKAVQEVAHREGVSVVVDKTGILYGHNAVDLTEKVLKYLKGG